MFSGMPDYIGISGVVIPINQPVKRAPKIRGQYTYFELTRLFGLGWIKYTVPDFRVPDFPAGISWHAAITRS
jgi:hypothetical protein